MTGDAKGAPDSSRRAVLRWLALAGLGGGIAVLGLDSVFRAPTLAASSSPTGKEGVRVKVVYYQMPQTVGNSEEYFDLEGPAQVSDLMRVATQRHPALAGMEQQMLILIDGVPADGNTGLRDGDEVDLIPSMVGG